VPGTSSAIVSDPKTPFRGSPSADSEHGLRRHNLRRQPEHRLDLDLHPYKHHGLDRARSLCPTELTTGAERDGSPG